jgi:hypothetical protein
MRALRRILSAGVGVSAVVMTGPPAFAEEPSGCATIAQRVVKEIPGQLLSVTARRDRCQIVYLTESDGPKPRRLVFDLEYKIGDALGLKGKRSGRGLVVPDRE